VLQVLPHFQGGDRSAAAQQELLCSTDSMHMGNAGFLSMAKTATPPAMS
jgi:hypothetical protein